MEGYDRGVGCVGWRVDYPTYVLYLEISNEKTIEVYAKIQAK